MTTLDFIYKNHEGRVEVRHVFPQQIWFGRSAYHGDEPAWFLIANDQDRDGAVRHFKMTDVLSWSVAND